MPVIDEYLKEVLSKRGSDLHFLAGDPPRIRLHGDLQPLRGDRLEREFVQNTLYEIMPKTADQRGRKAICETLVMTRAIAKLIQTDQTHQVPNQIMTGKELGMSLLDQSLLDALARKEIDPDDAVTYATNRVPFQRYVTDTTLMPKLDVTSPSAASGGGG